MGTYWKKAVKEHFKKQELERNKKQLAKANCSNHGMWLRNGLSTVLTESGDLFGQIKKVLYISALRTKFFMVTVIGIM
ncbi:hypothetical protein [Bacillus thuringiensis]|uniref:Transposase n=2 Tax=Bacillus TaxID=1386 RepID=A0ABD5HYX8_BACTU|nr:hypothetical protein [Bacillus thuringiensis]EEM93100.1 hypothetical protein bthur0013_55470 [Bacillus thuringiensis IBL 200]MCR6780131.1 hypothetical protein [Bacillus thuringiensis]MCR6858200.1 hypothetical protein [Bacillus thuringiensis]MCR6866581.1 hypothetical protein [Bacillus thuringiensis]MDW9210176.1 hypothetical protein [Bacillus thuringiensis serovar toumanoffi]